MTRPAVGQKSPPVACIKILSIRRQEAGARQTVATRSEQSYEVAIIVGFSIIHQVRDIRKLISLKHGHQIELVLLSQTLHLLRGRMKGLM